MAHTALAQPNRLSGLIRGWWRGYQRESDLRAAIRTLHRLDDHTLRDMGLRRDEIGRAVRGRC